MNNHIKNFLENNIFIEHNNKIIDEILIEVDKSINNGNTKYFNLIINQYKNKIKPEYLNNVINELTKYVEEQIIELSI
tara:strand:+ start:7359 stop:7592 length:234 start_codon:yes stop_codon:yes gene_type:complete